MSSPTDWITAIASVVSAGGVVFAVSQLRLTKQIHQRQFEDGLAKEYRELAGRIPTRALLGAGLSPDDFEESFDEFFRYIDLSNEQVALRMQARVSKPTWTTWSSGIRHNLRLPAFRMAWDRIQTANPDQFMELRKAISEDFGSDPATWKKGLER